MTTTLVAVLAFLLLWSSVAYCSARWELREARKERDAYRRLARWYCERCQKLEAKVLNPHPLKHSVSYSDVDSLMPNVVEEPQ